MHDDLRHLQDIISTIEDGILRTEALQSLQTIQGRMFYLHHLAKIIASSSHELRTPLNTIIGYAEILEAGMDGELNPEQSNDVGYINQAGTTLMYVWNDLWDLTRIELGEKSFKPDFIDLSPWLEKHRPKLETIAKEKGCTLAINMDRLPTNTQIESDESLLLQILGSLIQQAAQGIEGRYITLGLSAAIWLKQGIRFLIQEQGRGLNREGWDYCCRSKMIFETLGEKGLGLEQRLAQLMGAYLAIEAQVDGNCTNYILELP